MVAYAVISIGSRGTRVASVVCNAGDPFYGMSFSGFPTQILMQATGTPLIAVTILVVLPLAAGMGYLVAQRTTVDSPRGQARTTDGTRCSPGTDTSA